MRKLSAALLIFFGLASAALAQSAITTVVSQRSLAIPNDGAIVSRFVFVAGKVNQGIYVTSVLLAPAATAVVRFEYGTGAACNTGTTQVSDTMTFPASTILEIGSGIGPIWVIPPGNDLCLTIQTAIAPGSIAFAQF